MSLKWLTKSLCNHEPKNITLLQHLEVPPCSPLQPPQTTSWHPHQHALSSSSCPPASPSNFNRLQQLSGHRPPLSLRDTQKQWQGGPKIQTAQNNNTNWPHRYHKLSSERHISELIRSEPRDLVKKKKVMTWWLWTILQQPKSKIYTQSLVLDLFGQNVTIFLSTFVFYLLCTPTANDGFSYLQPHNTSFNFIRAFSEQTFP